MAGKDFPNRPYMTYFIAEACTLTPHYSPGNEGLIFWMPPHLSQKWIKKARTSAH